MEALPDCEFLDPKEDFDFQLLETWSAQIPAGDKNRLPLSRYRIGEKFLKRLNELREKRKKALKAIVGALVKDPGTRSARMAHQLRTHASGGS